MRPGGNTIADTMGRIPALLAAASLAIPVIGVAQEQPPQPQPSQQSPTSQSWELRGRDWAQVPSADPNAPADPQLDRVEQLLNGRRGKAAFGEAVAWLKTNANNAPQRDRALFLAARSLWVADDGVKAFYYCDELLDTYPESGYYQPALELQYSIADNYLDRGTRRFLGLPVGDYDDEATEMLFRVQQRAPGSQLAERALLRTADHYYARGDYDLAGDAYAAYARSYPRSPEVARVRLQQAYSYLAQFRDPKFDATPVVDARTQLADLLQTDPQLAQQNNVPALIDRIDSTLAQKLATNADYYRRTGKPQAAAFLYEQVVKTYPNTPEADQAQRALERLPAPQDADVPPATQPAARAGSEGIAKAR
jgi:outer membrane assembly lipoprotein YfiO